MWDAATRPSATAFFNNRILLATLLSCPRFPRNQNLRQSLHANALGVSAILEKQDQWQERSVLLGWLQLHTHMHTHTSVVIRAYEMSLENIWAMPCLPEFLDSREYGWFIYVFSLGTSYPMSRWICATWILQATIGHNQSFHRSGGFGPGPSSCHSLHHGGSDRGHAGAQHALLGKAEIRSSISR